MRFGRRKSTIAGECSQDETDARRRNRLSKPLTNKLSASLSTINIQEALIHDNDASSQEPASGGPLTSHPSSPNLRRQIRSQIFDEENNSPNQSLKDDSAWSVACMVSEIAENTAQPEGSEEPQPPASPLRPRKRRSFALRRLSTRHSTSQSGLGSHQQVKPSNGDVAAASTPTSSLDRIVDSPAIPPTRRASFTPGTATRKPSATVAPREVLKEHPVEDTETGNLVEVDDPDWQPPPPRMAGRAETPADLDYSHLGSLRLGSLQIVNGRVSPAFSELSKVSKHIPAAPQPHRDISSDYDEPVEDFHELIVPRGRSPQGNMPGDNLEQRIFSWESNEEKHSVAHPLQDVMPVPREVEYDKEDDQTSLMAKEYMAELPASPFSKHQSSSSAGSLTRSRSEGSLQESSSFSSLQKSPVLGLGNESCLPLSPHQRCPSPTGSVICRSGKEDVGLQCSQGSPGNDFEDEPELCEDAMMTWYSPARPSPSPEGAFQSVVEFQTRLSPGFPAFSTYLQPPHRVGNTDSGYSSSNSLEFLQKGKSASVTDIQFASDASPAHLYASTRPLEHGSSALEHASSILKPGGTDSTRPAFVDLRPAAVTVSSAPAVPTSDGAIVKQVKTRRKLQKKRPQSQPPSKIAISRVHSFEGDSIPRIPSDAEENLRIRSQEVPELERTYLSLNLMNHHASISSMDLATAEVRFPSPTPEGSNQVRRPRSRSRSRSRPRSWISRSRSREDGMSSRRDSGLTSAKMMTLVNEFGAAYSLGGGPYDLAHEHIRHGQATDHYDVPSVVPRPRPMMDDKTAAEFARRRSRSIQERDSMLAERKSGFNDRGGIPGKNLRPASFAKDAPPITPEMLQKAYRTSSEHRQASIGNGFAPLPPPHSPRPAYVEYEEDYSDMSIAPPPPSHSPRPVDITPDPWEAQPTAWQDCGQSAGNMRHSQYWDAGDFVESHDTIEAEPLYPEIPPRGGPQGFTRHQPSQDYYFSQPLYQDGFNRYAQYEQPGFSPYEEPQAYPDDREPRYKQHWHPDPVLQEIRQPRSRAILSPGPSQHRPLPSPRASGITSPGMRSPGIMSPRPHSQAGSARSHASSLAEDLHPDKLERPCPPPKFGRYSGGMGFGYERENGFGGSAGTRSVSGKAEAMRKGVALRASFGVDLSDVPVMMAVVRG